MDKGEKVTFITSPVVDGNESSYVRNMDRMYFRNFNPITAEVNKQDSSMDGTGALSGFLEKGKDVTCDVILPS